ncbi:MAG: rplX [Gammaproteobacteria bacterium]|jgi:large subunit ribosomal protein L24|nr:rplX [Gammaproteobacteria bacterium]
MIRNKYRIKKSDEVIVIAGRSKGVRGKVLRVCPDERVYVEGANMVTKHVKPNPNVNEPGGRKQMEAAIHISNVAIFNPKTKKADRVGYKHLADGKKVRIFRSTEEEIEI